MKNFVHPGAYLTVAAPYAVASGQGVLVGATFGVAVLDAANGAETQVSTTGVFDLAADPAATPAQGALAYWDDANRRISASAGGGAVKVGVFAVAKAAGVATARVRLNGAF